MSTIFFTHEPDSTERPAERVSPPPLPPVPPHPQRWPLTPSWKQGGLSGPGRPSHSDDSAAFVLGERSETMTGRGTLLYSLWSLFTLCTKKRPKDGSGGGGASVGAGHARVRPEVVEHGLDQLRQVVVVLPAPVLPRVGVVEIHRPAVGWRRRRKKR